MTRQRPSREPSQQHQRLRQLRQYLGVFQPLDHVQGAGVPARSLSHRTGWRKSHWLVAVAGVIALTAVGCGGGSSTTTDAGCVNPHTGISTPCGTPEAISAATFDERGHTTPDPDQLPSKAVLLGRQVAEDTLMFSDGAEVALRHNASAFRRLSAADQRTALKAAAKRFTDSGLVLSHGRARIVLTGLVRMEGP